MASYDLVVNDYRVTFKFLDGAGAETGEAHTYPGSNIMEFHALSDGWSFNRRLGEPYSYKYLFADVTKYNGVAIGVTTQATITTAILALIDGQQNQT